ncbi:hypothetical protein AAG570_008291 [Ranatra chinensis]|uniref:Estrogen-related receptor n=1 Tax=Ranatra chinensis TaxID=642074 RepID=A0ABD0XSR1_9HEMI
MMSDGSSGMVAAPVIKKEIECSPFQPCSPPNTTMYSPTTTIIPDILFQVEMCGSTRYGEISPGSPDRYYCSSTTQSMVDPLLTHTEEGIKEEEDMPRRLCLVCGDIASGFHYGVASCEACKAFFKRTIQGNIEYTCPAANDCEINKRRRKACQACRFQKCLRKGMLKEGVRLDRVRGGRQKYRRNTEVPYTVSSVLQNRTMLEALLGCEPELLSGSPERDSSQPVISTLNILSELHDRELVCIISWAKQIPGFTELSLTNQMRLLQSTWTEILTLSLAFRSLPPNGRLRFAVDFFFDEGQAQDCGAVELFQLVLACKKYFCLIQCITILEKLQRTLVCKEEYVLLKALVLANSDVKLDEAAALKSFRDSIVFALTDCVSVTRGSSNEITALLLCLPTLRQADSIVRRFWTNIHRGGSVVMNKLFVEMLDPSLR